MVHAGLCVLAGLHSVSQLDPANQLGCMTLTFWMSTMTRFLRSSLIMFPRGRVRPEGSLSSE